jgi:two-component system LytT family sensor kinase
VMDGSSSGVGMANTDLRLKSYFGPQSGLRVRATDRGYSVSFYIEDKKLQQEAVQDKKKEIIEEQIHLN